MTNTCIIKRKININVNFIMYVELIKNNEVTMAYFNTLYSHLEGQTNEWQSVRPAGNPTGIRADCLLNAS
jgi:hypothetical protein